jgi:hypothetical protein
MISSDKETNMDAALKLAALSILSVLLILVGNPRLGAKVLTKTWTTPSSVASGDLVSTAGDVNGDGYDDVLVLNGNSNELFLFRGSSSGVQKTVAWTVQLGGGYWGGFPAIARAGDVNGDGFDDVIVGSTSQSSVGPPSAKDGEVRLYLGSSTGLSIQPDWTDSRDLRRFGNSVAGVGDLNGDGYEDIAVGDPLNAVCPYSPNQQSSGAPSTVYVYFGSSSGLSAQPDWSYSHQNNEGFSSCLGLSVAGAGDVNNDGYDDLLVGAPFYPTDSSGQGKAYLFRGSSSGLGSSPDWSTTHPRALSGTFGTPGRGVGDVNDDGYDDVVVVGTGRYVENQMEFQDTRAFVFPGSPSGLKNQPEWIRSNAESTYMGAGDIDNDGISDIILPMSSPSPHDVAMFHGSSRGVFTEAAWSVTAPANTPSYGRTVDGAGDVNDDGYDDVIVGRDGRPATVFRGGPNPAPSAQAKSLTIIQTKSRVIGLPATDIHGDSLTFSIETYPTEGTIEGISPDEGEVRYKAPDEYTGADSFIFKAEDPYGGSDTATVDITVTPTNRPPEFIEPTPETELRADVGEPFQFDVVVDDPDGDVLTVEASKLPDGATFDAEARQFRWTPMPQQASGEYDVSMTADDGELSTTQTVTVVVEPEAMEDAGVDAGDPMPDTGMEDAGDVDAATGNDAATADTGTAQPTENGCGCSTTVGGSNQTPASPLFFLLVFGLFRFVPRIWNSNMRTRSSLTIWLPTVFAVLTFGCSGGGPSNDAGHMTDGSPMDVSDNGQPDTQTDTREENENCPSAEIPNLVPISVEGSLGELPNQFESSALEWGTAGDDALVFEAPESNTYEVELSVDGEDVADFGVAVPGGSNAFYTPETCPPAGAIETLPDAEYLATPSQPGTLELEEGERVLLIASCASTCQPTEPTYRITIREHPG